MGICKSYILGIVAFIGIVIDLTLILHGRYGAGSISIIMF